MTLEAEKLPSLAEPDDAPASRKRAADRRRDREAKERAELIAKVDASRCKYGRFEVEIPVRTVSPNRLMNENWMSRKGRRQRERKAVREAFARAFRFGMPAFPFVPCIAVLRRHGPAEQDSDSLPACQKSIRDEISVLISQGNDSERGGVDWRYEQARIWEKCQVRTKGGRMRSGLKTYVSLRIEALTELAPAGAPARCSEDVTTCRVPYGCEVVAGWTKIRRRRSKSDG